MIVEFHRDILADKIRDVAQYQILQFVIKMNETIWNSDVVV